MTSRDQWADTLTLAVRDALEEYLMRTHGVLAPAKPDWFLDWLRDRGHQVVPIDPPPDAPAV